MAISTADAPLTVSTDGTAGPYVTVTSEQLSPVTDAMRAEGVRFSVDQDAVLLNGAPALAVIDLGIGTDVVRVQGILDRVNDELQRKGRKRRRSPSLARQELTIRLDAQAMQQLRERFAAGPHGGWERRADVEIRFRQTLPQHIFAFCFSKKVSGVNRESAVILQGRTSAAREELHLSRVMPLTGRGQLDLAQHNLVVTDFQETFLKPLTRDIGARLFERRVNTKPSLEHLLSPVAAARLQAFSTLSNKNSLNQLDQQRWNEFVGQTHRDESLVDPAQLEEWLADEGFSTDLRKDLVAQFDSGRRLLATYDEETK